MAALERPPRHGATMTHPHLTAGSKIVNAKGSIVRSWRLLEAPRIVCPVDGRWKARAMFEWAGEAPFEVEMMIFSSQTEA